MCEQGTSGFIAAGIEVITLEFDSLVGDADPRPLRLNFRRGLKRLDRARRGVGYAGIVPWIVAKEELSRPVVVGRSQVGAAGAGGVPVGSTLIGDGGDPVCQGAPFAIPRLRVAGRDPFRGGDDLADIGPAVDGVADRAQRLERERFVGVEDEFHVRSLSEL